MPRNLDCRFSANDVTRATGISQSRLTNILSKYPLILCSDSPGQGRPRQFCLIDAYQIAIMAKLVELTGDVGFAAHNSNYLLFGWVSEKQRSVDLGFVESFAELGDFALGIESDAEKKIKALNELRKSLCASTHDWPAYYSNRDEEFFVACLVTATVSRDNFSAPGVYHLKDEKLHNILRLGAVTFSLTNCLNSVDNRLRVS